MLQQMTQQVPRMTARMMRRMTGTMSFLRFLTGPMTLSSIEISYIVLGRGFDTRNIPIARVFLITDQMANDKQKRSQWVDLE
jgi:hypothetical protein